MKTTLSLFQKIRKRNRHAVLCWKILENKILYYSPKELSEAFVQKHSITDAEYDKLEQEYLSLCIELDEPNTLVHQLPEGLQGLKGNGMMEVDWKRPSVNAAYEKMLNQDLRRKYKKEYKR